MTYSWSQLAAHYRGFGDPSIKAIADLCEYIDSRRIRSGIHGWQSMCDLGIAQIPVWHWDAPHLWITPVSRGEVEFRYVDSFVKQQQWHRRDPADAIIHRFKNTMRQLNWFTDPASLD
jgi:hypothetical protein